jgi:hypothetical protein
MGKRNITKNHPNPEGKYFTIKINPQEDFSEPLYEPLRSDLSLIALFTPKGELIGFLSDSRPELHSPGFNRFSLPSDLELFPPYEDLKKHIKDNVLSFED